MKKGFTLIEMLVALTLFSIIVAIAVGGFARALHTQRQVSALIAAQSNAGLTLEQMAREIRTGYEFCADASSTATLTHDTACAPPVCQHQPGGQAEEWTCSLLHFQNAQGASVTYSLNNGVLERNYEPVTGDNVSVKYLSFILFGQIAGDSWNPRITIAMGVSASSTDPAIANNVLQLQTTVSARAPDANASGTY